MITPEEALGQVYAMRESVANGKKFDSKFTETMLALADIIDDLQAKISRMEKQRVAAWGYRSVAGHIIDVITPEEHDRKEGEYTIPLFRLAGAQKIIEDF